jgi:hypothetical protein
MCASAQRPPYPCGSRRTGAGVKHGCRCAGDRAIGREVMVMTEPGWPNDEVLLAELRRALAWAWPGEADFETGRAAFRWRTIDGELAGLIHDCLIDNRVTDREASDSSSAPQVRRRVGVGSPQRPPGPHRRSTHPREAD